MTKTKENLILSSPPKYSSLKRIIEDESNNCALLIGNGFNYRYFNSTTTSWNKLVANLWNTANNEKNQLNEEMVKEYKLSLTQTAEMTENFSFEIRKKIASSFNSKVSDTPKALSFLSKIKDYNIPILTTNYDMNLEETLQCKMFNCSDSKRAHWGRYYAQSQVEEIVSSFGIWHIHGDVNHPMEICITLSDYINAVKKASKMIEGIDSPFVIGEVKKKPEFLQSWLRILFEKDLCIVGLGLEENETFLRWLLMQRSKYIKYRNKRHKGWYLYLGNGESEQNENISKAKLFFLRSVGIEPVKCSCYHDMYNL